MSYQHHLTPFVAGLHPIGPAAFVCGASVANGTQNRPRASEPPGAKEVSNGLFLSEIVNFVIVSLALFIFIVKTHPSSTGAFFGAISVLRGGSALSSPRLGRGRPGYPVGV